MMKYKVSIVLWEDHRKIDRGPLPEDPQELIFPTLSVGIVVKKTRKHIVLVSEIEKYEDRNDATYLVILRSCILGIKEYGEIELENPY